MKKTIISVVGQDTVGIIARVCTYLAENNINILMITDTSRSEKKLDRISEELSKLGEEIGVMIHAQHEDIFTKMHRI